MLGGLKVHLKSASRIPTRPGGPSPSDSSGKGATANLPKFCGGEMAKCNNNSGP